MVKRRPRVGWIVLLLLIGLSNALSVVGDVLAGKPWYFWLGSACLAAALPCAALALLLHRPEVVPRWARPYEVVMFASGASVRCVRCSGVVMVVTTNRLPMVRLLTYLYAHHASRECDAALAAEEAVLSRLQSRDAQETGEAAP